MGAAMMLYGDDGQGNTVPLPSSQKETHPQDVTVALRGMDCQYNGLPSGYTPPVPVREVTAWLQERAKARARQLEQQFRDDLAKEGLCRSK